MIKVKVIAPYIGLKDLILDMIKFQKNISVDVELGDLNEGLKIAERAMHQGYDLILSRGGTADLIRKNISIPVVEVLVSGYDMLRSLTLVKDYKGKIGIIGFKNIVEGATAVSALLDMDISRYLIKEANEVEYVIRHAINEGVEIVLGDVITVETANRFGLQGILITSGEESVNEAFDSIRKVYEMIKRKQDEQKLIEQILDKDERGILLLEEDTKKVLYVNQTLKQMLPKLDLYKGNFEEIYSNASDSIIINTKEINFQNKSLIAYNFITYEVLKQSFYKYNKLLLEVGRQESLSNFGQFIRNSEMMRAVIEKAKKYAVLKEPIMIIGDYGVGKRMLAEAIHQESPFKNGPFTFISFYGQEEDFTTNLFSSDSMPNKFELTQGGTLYIEGIEKASPNSFIRLLDFKAKYRDVRLILSSKIPHSQFLGLGDEYAFFYHQLTPFNISLPPLRNRIEDIPDLVRLFIAKSNTKYGKQMVGIKEDALDTLTKHSWPGNVDELRSVIDEAVIHSSGYYIYSGDITVIDENNQANDSKKMSTSKKAFQINLNRSLEEIEQEIIKAVLEEENMNQSKAAKRLGINRTTLWRKLKIN